MIQCGYCCREATCWMSRDIYACTINLSNYSITCGVQTERFYHAKTRLSVKDREWSPACKRIAEECHGAEGREFSLGMVASDRMVTSNYK